MSIVVVVGGGFFVALSIQIFGSFRALKHCACLIWFCLLIIFSCSLSPITRLIIAFGVYVFMSRAAYHSINKVHDDIELEV